jgi:hypothetical protein
MIRTFVSHQKIEMSPFQFDNQFVIKIKQDYQITQLKKRLEKMKILQPKLSELELFYIYNTCISKSEKKMKQPITKTKNYSNFNTIYF